MAIDTQSKRRSVHGYGIGTIAPVADGAITVPDREHIAWLYAGIAASAPAAAELPYQGDAYIYDASGGTGSINGSTVQAGEHAYDSAGGTGSISDGTVQTSEYAYDSSGGTGSITGATVMPAETTYE